MVDRDVLHKLVDTLPERVLDQVHHILMYQQDPLDEHQDMEKLQEQTAQHIRRHLERVDGGGAGSGGGGGMWPDGTGSFSVQGFDEDGGHLTITHRYFRGKALQIAERIAFSDGGRLLTYTQEITVPDGGRSSHQGQFSFWRGNE